ncbi:Hypothetical_protein [Hexamita inflata]|uniref:Hypothetical_protein n=1 Tax=Hexamita inflata TaxID=28002 RepID=A0AA86NFK7_9EUKA|nr:Hypothetical protein HINF_LOCUS6442 [Hexamita inflata]
MAHIHIYVLSQVKIVSLYISFQHFLINQFQQNLVFSSATYFIEKRMHSVFQIVWRCISVTVSELNQINPVRLLSCFYLRLQQTNIAIVLSNLSIWDLCAWCQIKFEME